MSSTVCIYKCTGYRKNKLKYIINEYFKNIDFKGKRVLLKPNMLQAHSPSENVTTHPAVVEAVAETVMEKGGNCSIGDSPSGWGLENAAKAAGKTGMLEVCSNLNIKFDYFDGQATKKIKVKNGTVYNRIYLPLSYFFYDIVINIPKLKTHALTMFTLGVKNMFGLIPGLGKADFHRKAAHPKIFASALCDIYSLVKPDYTILDGIEGMEGEGPVNGRTRKLNRIFISTDANALDAVVENMCGIDPQKVHLTREVAERGLGEIDNINIVKTYDGDESEFRGFKTSLLSRLGSKLPVWTLEILSPFLLCRPSVDKELCTSCKKCVEICPAEAIDFGEKYPDFDMKKCIKCFCCAERCPESIISEKKSMLAKLLT